MTPYAFPPDVLLFRVEPESRSQYFRVYIWPTLKAMRAYIRTFGETTLVNRGHAFTLDWTIHHRGQVPRGLLGEMHFARRHLGEDFIGHEALHAALIFARGKELTCRVRLSVMIRKATLRNGFVMYWAACVARSRRRLSGMGICDA